MAQDDLLPPACGSAADTAWPGIRRKRRPGADGGGPIIPGTPRFHSGHLLRPAYGGVPGTAAGIRNLRQGQILEAIGCSLWHDTNKPQLKKRIRSAERPALPLPYCREPCRHGRRPRHPLDGDSWPTIRYPLQAVSFVKQPFLPSPPADLNGPLQKYRNTVK